MSIWNRLIRKRNAEDTSHTAGNQSPSVPYGSIRYAIVDVEVGLNDCKIHDIGALRHDGATYHKASKEGLLEFLKNTDYICGHNVIHHDAKYLLANKTNRWIWVDTLFLSPLLFPERPYHKLLKDDKLISDQMNNPVNDCEKAKDLLFDEMSRWCSLPDGKRKLFASLLKGQKEFEGFLSMVNAEYTDKGLSELIQTLYEGKICQRADIDMLIKQYPCELAYALALIDTTDYRSITPGWVLYNYPKVEYAVKLLRHTRCKKGCIYCNTQLNVRHHLNTFFGYKQFRTYEGEPLQERAAQAAVDGKSLLAVFPTGGGKSLTFQLPALMEGRSVHGLTVVISPLQSLMKDQVDNLAEKRHHRCRNHQRTVRPYHKSIIHTKGTKRRSLPLIYSPRNAPFKNHRKDSDGTPCREVRNRRGSLFFFMGAGFQSRLPLYRQVHPRIPTKEKMYKSNPGILFHCHSKAKSSARHLRLFQTDIRFKFRAVCLNGIKEEPSLFRHTRRNRRRQIFKAKNTHSRIQLPYHYLCITYQTNGRTV